MAYFDDKTIWLTGASSGIGAALARALGEQRCRLILSARRAALLEQVAAGCQMADVRLLPFDLADHTATAAIVSEALAYWGDIDLLIHNAGVGQRGGAVETRLEVAKYIMDVNFFGPVVLTQSVLPRMIERGKGHIVVISSVLGRFHLPRRSFYVAAKHALHGYFDTLRAEIGSRGIDITIICPGWVATDIAANALQADGRPYGKSGRPAEKQMSAEKCARHILAAICRRRREVYIGGFEVYGRWVKLLWPTFFDRLVTRMA